LNSYKTREDSVFKQTDEIEQYVFSLAKKYGFDNWIEYDKSLNKYFSTVLMESDLHKYIDKYNHNRTK
jgi:hypothetical protein